MTRVLVGQLSQESHEFSPIPTGAADFVVEYGSEMLTTNAEGGSTLGGILRHLRQAGVEATPTLAARARPGGRVERAVYEGFRDRILASAAEGAPVDAVVFDLHGAMSANGYESAEADLMSRLRALLGPEVVIAIGLDLHGHITDELMAACDIVTACKENPHSDVVEAGECAARLALSMLAGRIRPRTTMIKLPALCFGETADGPLYDLHAMARALLKNDSRLLDISIFNVHPFRDAADMGQAIIAIADGDTGAADAAALPVARRMWEWRSRFEYNFPDVDEVLDLVLAQPEGRPYAVGDLGDLVLGGAPGDGLVILRRLLERDLPLRGVFPVTDPDTAAAALSAGPGAVVERPVGGGMTPGFESLTLRLRVRHTDPVGEFVQKGPFQAGQRTTLGPCAVLEDDRGNLILATTAAGMTQDPAAFTSQGIDLAVCDFVVCKSAHHFKLSFAGVATPLMANTPGLTNYRPGFLPFTKSRLWPEDPELELRSLRLRHFGRGDDPDGAASV